MAFFRSHGFLIRLSTKTHISSEGSSVATIDIAVYSYVAT